ncbi:LCP family protein [Catellatospora vulcania]|uniref:LCP family protein n=1 Tax=Catellatospora vulcania TaxID=1460450 RepID=UPI0012D454D5|nr:LCP family protein [Catellatospora vulcania]
MIEEELREAFARHEEQAPPLDPLRRAIDALAARRRRRRTATRSGAAAVAMALALAVPVQLWRGDLLPSIPLVGSDSVAAAPTGPLNLLLLGLDQRGDMGDARADTIMLVHLPADGSAAYLVSIERDVAVEIPGEGRRKINGAYTVGGAQGARQVVERLTGVRVDAVAEVGFAALRPVIDALGPLPFCLPQRVTSQHTGRFYPAGCREHTGAEVEDLVRQRQGMPHGGYDRDRIGQRVLLGLVKKAGDRALLSDFGMVSRLASTPGITLHTGDLSLLGLAMRLDRVEAADVVGVSQPTFRPVTYDGWPYEQLDPQVAPELFAALRGDTMNEFVLLHPAWVIQK